MTFRILQGDNRDVLKTIEDNSIDAIVTDPPYGIDFLGKEWDANTGALETYQECLRVLKPGGHILAFSAARTYHHLAVTLEQAGFEIRDQIMWIYSSGFPKSQDIGRSIQRSLGVKKKKTIKSVNGLNTKGLMNFNEEKGEYTKTFDIVEVTDPEAKQWEGWGTALKPAHEPICLARKPLKTSIAKNCQEWGTGALNIDATRVPSEKRMVLTPKKGTYQCVEDSHSPTKATADNMEMKEYGDRFPSNVLGEIPDYQKYFYCPKVSRRERHIGYSEDEKAGNNHPTVKPVELMKYLIKLITPPGGTVLDPFNGSGSTGMAAVELGYDYTGIELDPNYVKIAEQRIQAWANKDMAENNFKELFQEDATE